MIKGAMKVSLLIMALLIGGTPAKAMATQATTTVQEQGAQQYIGLEGYRLYYEGIEYPCYIYKEKDNYLVPKEVITKINMQVDFKSVQSTKINEKDYVNINTLGTNYKINTYDQQKVVYLYEDLISGQSKFTIKSEKSPVTWEAKYENGRLVLGVQEIQEMPDLRITMKVRHNGAYMQGKEAYHSVSHFDGDKSRQSRTCYMSNIVDWSTADTITQRHDISTCHVEYILKDGIYQIDIELVNQDIWGEYGNSVSDDLRFEITIKDGNATFEHQPDYIHSFKLLQELSIDVRKRFMNKNDLLLPSTEVEKISNDIVKGCTSDLERAQRIYKWLVENIQYDTQMRNDIVNGKTADVSPLTVLKTRKTVCQGYAELFRYMAVYQGIPAVVLGSEIMNHAWNAVWIDNEWRIYDATWGTEYTDYSNMKLEDGVHTFTDLELYQIF